MILTFFMVENVRDHVRMMGGKRMTRSETEATAVSAMKLACLSRHFDGTDRSQTPRIGRQMMILTTVMAMQNATWKAIVAQRNMVVFRNCLKTRTSRRSRASLVEKLAML